MSADQYQSMDITRVRQTLAHLHQQVAGGHRRIEIKRRGSDEVCVIISKSELEALEEALEILCQSHDYRQMCDEVSQIAADCGGVPCTTDA